MRSLVRGKYAWVTGLLCAGLLIWGLQATANANSGQYYVPPGVELLPCTPIYSISTGAMLNDCDGGAHPVITWQDCKDGRTLYRVDDGDTVHWGYDGAYAVDGVQGYNSALERCDAE